MTLDLNLTAGYSMDYYALNQEIYQIFKKIGKKSLCLSGCLVFLSGSRPISKTQKVLEG